jgi:alpha-D-ribose 1-methylphosphonate 5-triphosphate synthase subunit PhnH
MIAVEKSFDRVFDAQQVFRCILDAMARPGKVNLLPVTGLCPPGGWCSRVAAVAFTLLDREVAFCVLGGETEEITNYLAVNTGSRPVQVEAADFIIAPGREAIPGLALAGRGTLEHPDGGATVIIIIDEILFDGEIPAASEHRGLAVTLSGPGIPGHRRLLFRGLHPSYLEHFKVLNREYPQGVDWIIVAGDGRVACLPRTTTVHREVGI